jgi:serine/threonine protein kinase
MEAGSTIAGKYRLNRLLGTGGMATVWSATNVFTEREFAIKFMLPQVARTPEAARRFLLEAKVSARINHPNIIEVIDVGQAEDGSLFLVMELLTGVSLDVAVRRQQPPMTVADFAGIMRECAEALAAAHRSGVIHRDLKPTNVFLHKDRDGNVVPKVLDFGVSKILEEEANTALTVVGTVLGSPLYMSPEQAMGAAGIDGRTDVFAFGGILFEALTGQRAFDAPNFNALIVTIATKQPKSIDEAAPTLPEALRALVRDCMVTDKTKRLASFDLIVGRLTSMHDELEKLELRLPSPYGAERPSDPDATNALPVMRKSDRPAAAAPVSPKGPGSGHAKAAPPANAAGSAQAQGQGQASSSSSASAPPPGGHPSPLAMQISTTPSAFAPSRGPLETWLRGAETYVRGLPPRTVALAAGGAGAVVLLLIVVGIAAAFTRGGGTQPVAVKASAGATVAAASPQPTETTAEPPRPAPTGSVPSADESAEVPVVSIESLPVATRGAPARGNGRLSIVAGTGRCTVSVDGVARGTTPLAAFELPAGAHRVECVWPGGRARSASVSVAEGTATHYKFALDD